MSFSGDVEDFKEYPLHSSLLQQIPAKAQKTFDLSTFDVEFTCVDADGHYLAIGTNIGFVYLIDRRNNQITKLRNENRDAIVRVKILLSLDCMVAFGCKSGAVLAFKIPFDSSQKLEKFLVDGFHSHPVSCLEWMKNGTQFFTGDEEGRVVSTEIDHFKHQSRSRVLLESGSRVVQLSHSHNHLVVSNLFRSVVYSCQDDKTHRIGQKERKCFGPFGAVNFHSHDPLGCIYASRPGQRLWKSDRTGVIHETILFKSALNEQHPVIPLLNGSSQQMDYTDFQFGQLRNLKDQCLLVSSDSAIVLVNPEQKSVVASSPRLDPIVDVAICSDEIFILRGLRHLIMISSHPDPYACDTIPDEPSLMEELLVPFKEFTTFMKERTSSLSSQSEPIKNRMFDWLKKKESTTDMNEGLSKPHSNSLPEIVKIENENLTPVVTANSNKEDPLPIIEITAPLRADETDDIVYKPKKKVKKKVRFRSKSPNKRNPLNDEKDASSYHKTKPDTVSTHSDDNTSTNIDCDDNCNINDSKTSDGGSSVTDNEISVVDESNPKDVTPTDKTTDTQDSLKEDCLIDNEDISSDPNSNFLLSDINTEPFLDLEHGIDSTSSERAPDAVDSSDGKTCDPDDIYCLYNNDSGSLSPPPIQDVSESSTESSSPNNNDVVLSDDSNVTKYGVEWVEYKAPEVLLDICVSNDNIFCVDVRNQIYMSEYPVLGLQWKRLDQPAELISVSSFETVVWALYKGTIFAALQKTSTKWQDVEWMSIARDVASMSVDDDCGWYVTCSGFLTLQDNMNPSRPYGYPVSVPFSAAVSQVSYHNGVVWILTAGKRIFCATNKKQGDKWSWKAIELSELVEVDSIYLGVHHTGWIIDGTGIIRFVMDVTPETPRGKDKMWEVEASQYYLKQSQLKKVVLKAEILSALIKGKQQVALSSSAFGVWFCKTMDNKLYANQNDLIGHSWDGVVPVGTSSSTKWALVSASGVASNSGSVWCLSKTGEFFCLCNSTRTLISIDLPCIDTIQCVVSSHLALWVLTESGRLFARGGITTYCQEGNRWQEINTAQLGADTLAHTSCASDVSWSCNAEGSVLLRLGPLCPSSNRALPQAWIPLESPPFEKVYVGPSGFPVWSVDNKGGVYVREGVSSSLPLGTGWTSVPELRAKDLCISRTAVWLLKYSGKIYRRFGVSERNPCGDYWKQIPGMLDILSVTEDDDLWGLKDEQLFLHSSMVLQFAQKEVSHRPFLRTAVSEEDWEDIMAFPLDDE